MSVKKYFWNLNESALKKVRSILKNPAHPQYPQRAIAVLSRTNKPEEAFRHIPRGQFAESWPSIRKYWMKTGGSDEFRSWWETVYEEISGKAKPSEDDGIIKEVGRIIRGKRIEKGWSQKDLAVRTGFDQPYISRIEKGARMEVPSLIKICRALGIKNIPV
ncbi:MAG: helix-turn-helix transcriptional regulator [Endomicrobiia bacterium]|nr:helix-turn-helix transcriptional regulator [Endomicrobiia bacterium]